MRNVKADSLADVFTDSSLSAFTQSAINKGVTQDSIIYITCDENDAAIFGELYVEGSNWIWAKGEMTGDRGNVDSEPVSTVEEFDLLPSELQVRAQRASINLAKFFGVDSTVYDEYETPDPVDIITELETITGVMESNSSLIPTYVDIPETYQNQEGIRRYYDDGTDEFISNE